MQRRWARGDRPGVARACERTAALLREIETGSPDRPTRRQAARAYFDIGVWYRDLGDAAAARRALEESKARCVELVAAGPDDYFARAQLAACHNHLGLIAAAAGDRPAAEDDYRAAVDARLDALNLFPGHEDEVLNVAYLGGVCCNLGNLYADWGEPKLAVEWYDDGIFYLAAVVPPDRGREAHEDADASGFFMSLWEQNSGVSHPVRVARQFLANARAGRAAAAGDAQAEPGAAPDPAGM